MAGGAWLGNTLTTPLTARSSRTRWGSMLPMHDNSMQCVIQAGVPRNLYILYGSPA